ncbi:hypothetical protein ACFUJR_14865 [Streptomyces sp. NPDC057271]|uniref:DUF7739 domain-containing protein n=1 Tax=unclassified Streptomyces TaxID=2593676 RepID=UPI003629ACB1
MGWNISHGGTKYGYSYSGMAELARRCSGILTRQDWAHVSAVMGRRSGDPFKVQPEQAQKVGDALLLAAGYLPDDWAAMAQQIGQSAIRAAKARESWEWS